MMKQISPILLVLVLAAGCGGKNEAPSQPAAPKQSSANISSLLTNAESAGGGAPSQPAEGDAPTAIAPRGIGGSEIDPAIKAAIQKYVANKKTSPRSWIDLTSERGYLDDIPKGKDGQPLDFDKVMAKLNIKTL
jgi:hypothetical protein